MSWSKKKLSDVEDANLYTRQQNEREDQHRKSVYNIYDSRERDGKDYNSYNEFAAKKGQVVQTFVE